VRYQEGVMTQTSFFARLVFPANPFKPDSQNYRLYERLKDGPVTNAEIVRDHGIFNSTGRASEVREFLAPFGIKLHCVRLHDGLFEYRLSGTSMVAMKTGLQELYPGPSEGMRT
jgi:hypothetical protein